MAFFYVHLVISAEILIGFSCWKKYDKLSVYFSGVTLLKNAHGFEQGNNRIVEAGPAPGVKLINT
jgi:hypothetical protein